MYTRTQNYNSSLKLQMTLVKVNNFVVIINNFVAEYMIENKCHFPTKINIIVYIIIYEHVLNECFCMLKFCHLN